MVLCDPNIGDTGGLFQPEAVAIAIRDRLLPLADIAAPNRFEFDWLSDAAGRLGPPEVIITSAATHADTIETWVTAPAGRVRLTHRWLPDNTVNGTGDLFAALYLGHRLDGAAPQQAATRSSAAVLAMIDAANGQGLDEIPIASGQDAIVAPATGITVTELSEG